MVFLFKTNITYLFWNPEFQSDVELFEFDLNTNSSKLYIVNPKCLILESIQLIKEHKAA